MNDESYERFVLNLNNTFKDIEAQRIAFDEIKRAIDELEQQQDINPVARQKLERLQQLTQSEQFYQMKRNAELEVQYLEKQIIQMKKDMQQNVDRAMPTISVDIKKSNASKKSQRRFV